MGEMYSASGINSSENKIYLDEGVYTVNIVDTLNINGVQLIYNDAITLYCINSYNSTTFSIQDAGWYVLRFRPEQANTETYAGNITLVKDSQFSPSDIYNGGDYTLQANKELVLPIKEDCNTLFCNDEISVTYIPNGINSINLRNQLNNLGITPEETTEEMMEQLEELGVEANV